MLTRDGTALCVATLTLFYPSARGRKHESACVIFDEVDAKEAWPETFHEAILEIERESLWEMTGQVSHLPRELLYSSTTATSRKTATRRKTGQVRAPHGGRTSSEKPGRRRAWEGARKMCCSLSLHPVANLRRVSSEHAACSASWASAGCSLRRCTSCHHLERRLACSVFRGQPSRSRMPVSSW